MKSVRFGEVEDLMEEMMRAPISQIGNKSIYDTRLTLDPNLIMDLRHQIVREPGDIPQDKNAALIEATRFIMDEETQAILRKREQEVLQSELKKFEKQLSDSRPKFRGPYSCSKRKILVNSDDEELWISTRRAKVKIRNFKRAGGSGPRKFGKREEFSEPKLGDNEESYIGSIKVTIKDKPISESKEKDCELMRWVFNVLTVHMKETKRLRELKTKVQEKLASRRLKTFFDVWKIKVQNSRDSATRKREEREISDERKIELFVNAIAEKQKRLEKMHKNVIKEGMKGRSKSAANSADTPFSEGKIPKSAACKVIHVVEPPLQNRLNAQKKIIADQKMKLAEQNRIIEDMKLKQIEEESRRAGRETINSAKEALTNCGQRTRRTLIQLMKEEGCRDKSVVNPPRLQSPPRFMMRMEARAEARRERAKRAEEDRRRKLEEQKLKEETAKKEEEEIRKRLQLEAQREAKRIREEQEKRKSREAERTKIANELADAFYRRYLLRHYVMDPFIQLMELKYNHLQKADDYYKNFLLKKTFSSWKKEMYSQKNLKEELCCSIYNRNSLYHFLKEWKSWTTQEVKKRQVACDYHDMKLQEKYLKLWERKSMERRVKNIENEEIAINHFEEKLIKTYFRVWRKFLEISDDVKESEKRKEHWRELIQRIVPDFAPKFRGVVIDD